MNQLIIKVRFKHEAKRSYVWTDKISTNKRTIMYLDNWYIPLNFIPCDSYKRSHDPEGHSVWYVLICFLNNFSDLISLKWFTNDRHAFACLRLFYWLREFSCKFPSKRELAYETTKWNASINLLNLHLVCLSLRVRFSLSSLSFFLSKSWSFETTD